MIILYGTRRDPSKRSLTTSCREIRFRVWLREDPRFSKIFKLEKRETDHSQVSLTVWWERIIRWYSNGQGRKLDNFGNLIGNIVNCEIGCASCVCNPESRLWRKRAEMARAVSTTLSFHRVPRLHWRSSINYTASLVDTLSVPIPCSLQGDITIPFEPNHIVQESIL